MRGVSLGVAVVALGLFLTGLGAAPFVDPPEGFHVEAARQMALRHDWVTPSVNGVRSLDVPPLLYWLVSASSAALGPTPLAARLWSALAAVGIAAVTARLGVVLGGPRVGLLAGLMTVANLGVFVYGRIVTPDLVFVLWLTLAWAGFTIAYRGGGRRGLVLFYASLGLAAMTRGLLGALAPLAVIGLFFWLTRERPLAPWIPWWGVLLGAGIALPWYLAVEAGSHGFLRYTLVDNHLPSLARHRIFSGVEFLATTACAFLPWTLALPWALARVFRRPWEDATARLWLLLGLWSVIVIGFFMASPFRLPHDGLPAFPALALLVARAWDETIDAAPGAARPRALLSPALILFVLSATAFAALWAGLIRMPAGAPASPDGWRPLLLRGAVISTLASVALAVAVWRRAPALGVGVALAATIAFLSVVAGDGMAQLARSRSIGPLAIAVAARARPGDLVVQEGPIENVASALPLLPGPIRVVNGLDSSLAFGATFPEARDTFWGTARLEAAWAAPGRHFLLSTAPPDASVVASLPPESVRVIARSGPRWLYSNVPD